MIRKGEKSLEEISKAVFQYENTYERQTGIQQRPIYRSNIGGTIFFKVEDYMPYKVEKVYEETEDYIIYEVEPVHVPSAKRLSVKVILRYECTVEKIIAIAHEIREKVSFCEVFQNQAFANRFSGYPANIIWCYFGYDEDDMVNSNFAYRTTWVDQTQDKNYWYSEGKNSQVIEDTWITIVPTYSMVKSMYAKNQLSKEEYIQKVRNIGSNVIEAGEKYISYFREYKNSVITEEELCDAVSKLNHLIQQLYLEYTDLPIAPKELHNWEQKYMNVISRIHDFTLYYNPKYLDKRSQKNRADVMEISIKGYQQDLQELLEEESRVG